MAGRAASSGLCLVAPGCCRRTSGCGGRGALTDREGGRQFRPELRRVGNRAPGVNAIIVARFSQGVPWQINIISYDEPTQAAATGTTGSFAIPTQFRGDQLATMEAKYADGSPAGPSNWTSYKEFWTNFQPDYGANSILMKPEFFAEVDNGPVTLTFHFWSGTQITYRLSKSGSSVTGSPV